MSIKEVLTKILHWIKYPHLHGQTGLDTYYRVTNTDNNTAVAFGIGSSGTRHGVWSTTLGKWMLYSDGTSVYVNEMKVADTVVEAGPSGIWAYRKWNSGRAECWGHTADASTACTSGWGNAYYAPKRTLAFPSGLFNNNSKVDIAASAWSYGGLFNVAFDNWTKDQVEYYIYSPKNETRTAGVSFVVTGTWK